MDIAAIAEEVFGIKFKEIVENRGSLWKMRKALWAIDVYDNKTTAFHIPYNSVIFVVKHTTSSHEEFRNCIQFFYKERFYSCVVNDLRLSFKPTCGSNMFY